MLYREERHYPGRPYEQNQAAFPKTLPAILVPWAPLVNSQIIAPFKLYQL